jgi:ADP-ribosylglycohydrolase
MFMESNTRNKVFGALFGVAYGDAFGMPVEFWSRKRTKERFGKIETFLPAPDDNEITHGLRAGEVTDDTYMTTIITEALIESRGIIEPYNLVKKITTWAEENKSKITALFGPSTKKAFELILSGTPVEKAGRFGTTNGSAMRIIPVGIISDWREPAELIDNVRLACLPTHNTNHAIAASAAIAAAASYAISGNNSIDELISTAISAGEAGACLGYESIGPSVSRKIIQAIKIAEATREDEDFLNEIYNLVGTGLPAYEAIPAALACVKRAKGDPVKCSRLTANCGGDTDTIGAMACGICGAYSGIDSFPADIVKRITEINNIDFGTYADALIEIKNKRN